MRGEGVGGVGPIKSPSQTDGRAEAASDSGVNVGREVCGGMVPRPSSLVSLAASSLWFGLLSSSESLRTMISGVGGLGGSVGEEEPGSQETASSSSSSSSPPRTANGFDELRIGDFEAITLGSTVSGFVFVGDLQERRISTVFQPKYCSSDGPVGGRSTDPIGGCGGEIFGCLNFRLMELGTRLVTVGETRRSTRASSSASVEGSVGSESHPFPSGAPCMYGNSPRSKPEFSRWRRQMPLQCAQHLEKCRSWISS